MELRFEAELWEHDGQGAWHFVSVPRELSDELRDLGSSAGFGSIRVEVTVGESVWRTSVFPSRTGEYVLPVKKPVRRAEGLEAGDLVRAQLRVL